MKTSSVVGDNIADDGIDRKKLAHIKQAFLSLNQERYRRILAALSDRQQQFLSLLPLLFHVNHPMLPGYSGHHTPAGVVGYTPSKTDTRTAKIIARSFTFQRDLSEKKQAINALYIMGSLGTIAHSESSDIDVWVCHAEWLNEQELQALQEKCDLLTQWAEEVIHIEAHFFLMDAEKFRTGQQCVLTSEASGSAQHFLLLDEFYRTAVWLAGKVPLWWFVPVEQEGDYDYYTQLLLKKRFVQEKDVIDFGGIPSIPTNEFIGAGVWQLYKGIDSPYKSVLKLLLLESYTNSAFSEPLSLDLKREIFKGNTEANVLDAYFLMYQRLESYLLAQNQLARLELIRRCFYFKAGKFLSKHNRNTTKPWQRLLLEELVKLWGWNNHLLIMLDSRPYWKSPHVIAERNLLANELSQAYRLLSNINKNTQGDAAISDNEMLILGRKLHAAFERKAGKIDLINPHISQDLSEPTLCFVEVVENNSSLWHVYRGSEQDFILRNQTTDPIKRSRNFVELIFWCHCNGILVEKTKLDIVSKQFSLQAIQRKQLIQMINKWAPLPQSKPSHDAFLKNAQPIKIAMFFNIGVEPQAELYKKGMQMLSSQRDAFGYSGFKENLIIRADVVQTNSWGEIICRHFAEDAIVNCLLYYLRLITTDKQGILPDITIRCFNMGYGNTIEQRVIALWRSVMSCFFRKSSEYQPRFIFEMAEEYFLLDIKQQQPKITQFKNCEKLIEALSQTQPVFSPIVIDAFALQDHSLRAICEIAKTPSIYLFFKIDINVVQLTIVDDKGTFFTKHAKFHTLATFLNPLIRFVRNVMERNSLSGEMYRKNGLDDFQKINIYELLEDKKQKNIYVESRQIDKNVSPLSFINVCAVAEPSGDRLVFTLYCNGKEFSALEYGEQLFAVVARYILHFRKQGELYPCYITDLDLSLCREVIAPQASIQLVHYLTIKDDLEKKLNSAINNQ